MYSFLLVYDVFIKVSSPPCVDVLCICLLVCDSVFLPAYAPCSLENVYVLYVLVVVTEKN
jgi:hypothetical protein